MSESELQELYAKGRIPWPPVFAVIERSVRDLDPMVMEKQFGVNHKWFSHPEENNSIEFDVADRLLCKLNLQDSWRSELSDHYYSVDISAPRSQSTQRREAWDRSKGVARCARAGCLKTYKPKNKRQKFCSNACRTYDYLMRTGKRRPRHESKEFVCRNGHERSKENTYVSPAGKRCCRICRSARFRFEEEERRGRARLDDSAARKPAPKRRSVQGVSLPASS